MPERGGNSQSCPLGTALRRLPELGPVPEYPGARPNLRLSIPVSHRGRRTRAPNLRRVDLGHLSTGVEPFSRLQHLTSACDPTADPALRRAKDVIVSAPCSSPLSPPGSLEARPTKGSSPTSRPLAAPQAPTRESDNSSNPRRPLATPSTVKKTAPQRKPGYPPIAGHISSMDSFGPTISPTRTATGAHTAAQASPIKTASRMRLGHTLSRTRFCMPIFSQRPYRVSAVLDAQARRSMASSEVLLPLQTGR